VTTGAAGASDARFPSQPASRTATTIKVADTALFDLRRFCGTPTMSDSVGTPQRT
jgi:hypothetical protein